MVELNNRIQIFFVISTIILSVQALEISILEVLSDFKCKTKILAETLPSGDKLYNGTALKSYYHEAFNQKSTVIAYFVNETRFEEIANADALGIRTEIGQTLGQYNHELVVFGIKNCEDNEFNLISAFLYDFIQPDLTRREVKILGEEQATIKHPFGKYQERREIYNGALKQHITTCFPKMAYRTKRPDPSNIKEVRFYDNVRGSREYDKETRWPVIVENGVYQPSGYTNLRQMKNNFMRRHVGVKSYHILIVDGKDYDLLTTKTMPLFEEMKRIMKNMMKNNEILFVMGCFNFDWSDIELVSQIILTHSAVPGKCKKYDVFTIGIGMFDTIFHNLDEYNNRQLRQSSHTELIAFVKKCFGRTMNRKTIEVFDLNSSNAATYEIELKNGRCESKNFLLTNQFARYAFIVIDVDEMYRQNVFSVAQRHPLVKKLQSQGIGLFLIKLDNFRLHDLHIIPEWIENNRNAVPPNRIAVLGGGSCNTIFQFLSPQYQVTYTLLNVANELKEIREAFVATADYKSIILANIYVPNSPIKQFPMHTINGFYDPVVLSGNDMISTSGNTRILFLIMQADKMTKAGSKWPTLITTLRHNITNTYQSSQWTVHLVGLHNFVEKDFHLFAEFVKCFTNDNRPLREFVWTFGDGIYQSMYGYRYRDTLPFFTAMELPMAGAFTDLFKAIA